MFVPKTPNRPSILAVSCDTGLNLSYSFIKNGAAVYFGAMRPVAAVMLYSPLKDDLISVGEEFKNSKQF